MVRVKIIPSIEAFYERLNRTVENQQVCLKTYDILTQTNQHLSCYRTAIDRLIRIHITVQVYHTFEYRCTNMYQYSNLTPSD